jgi:hypothetical protein
VRAHIEDVLVESNRPRQATHLVMALDDDHFPARAHQRRSRAKPGHSGSHYDDWPWFPARFGHEGRLHASGLPAGPLLVPNPFIIGTLRPQACGIPIPGIQGLAAMTLCHGSNVIQTDIGRFTGRFCHFCDSAIRLVGQIDDEE